MFERFRLVPLLLLALLAPLAAKAEEPSLFGSYETLCGYQVVYWPTRHVALSHITPDGREIIVLDPILQRGSEDARRRFLAAHECAHHRMGHSKPASVARRIADAAEVADQELSADCWAAETLARAGEMDAVLHIADMFYRGGNASPGSGYPSGIQRALTIKRCGEIGLSRIGKARQIARNGAILSIFD